MIYYPFYSLQIDRAYSFKLYFKLLDTQYVLTGSIRYYSTTTDEMILDKANKEISRFLWKDFVASQVIVLSYIDCMDKSGKVSRDHYY